MTTFWPGKLAEKHRSSWLILARDKLPDPREREWSGKTVSDGRITFETILGSWQQAADLVVFSAGKTALGKSVRGEGYVGFTRVLLLTGARSVVLSRWAVDDTATALLMVRFYENLLGKRKGLKKTLEKAEALAEAKKWLRELSRKEAEFVLIGDPT